MKHFQYLDTVFYVPVKCYWHFFYDGLKVKPRLFLMKDILYQAKHGLRYYS